MSNTTGIIFKVTSFGESHGAGIGVVIDGCPAGLVFDNQLLQNDMYRRKPGQSSITTQRKEDDTVEILSGLWEGKTTGSPIAMLIRNHDARPDDYDTIKDIYRPSHADYTYDAKYGIRDHRGGGRSSARITAGWVAAGAVAKMLLQTEGITIKAFVSQVYNIKLNRHYSELKLSDAENNKVRCPDAATAIQMEEAIENAKKEGDSLGGIVSCVIKNCPAGVGEPIFDKLHANIGKAMLNINAVKGVEFGDGFESVLQKGSEFNDLFVLKGEKAGTTTNRSGGVQGGISNGEDIFFRVAFKPTATIQAEQTTINKAGNTVFYKPDGRHDPCVVPRAVPIVEAMAAMVVADLLLLHKKSKL